MLPLINMRYLEVKFFLKGDNLFGGLRNGER
jgi:hypothetical protein